MRHCALHPLRSRAHRSTHPAEYRSTLGFSTYGTYLAGYGTACASSASARALLPLSPLRSTSTNAYVSARTRAHTHARTQTRTAESADIVTHSHTGESAHAHARAHTRTRRHTLVCTHAGTCLIAILLFTLLCTSRIFTSSSYLSQSECCNTALCVATRRSSCPIINIVGISTLVQKVEWIINRYTRCAAANLMSPYE